LPQITILSFGSALEDKAQLKGLIKDALDSSILVALQNSFTSVLGKIHQTSKSNSINDITVYSKQKNYSLPLIYSYKSNNLFIEEQKP
jgi:hypothetical protein